MEIEIQQEDVDMLAEWLANQGGRPRFFSRLAVALREESEIKITIVEE